METQLFHPVATVPGDDPEAPGIRHYVGSGTPHLRVPGLLDIARITIDGVEIPTVLEEEVIDPEDRSKRKTVALPMLRIAESPDGETLLLRNVKSNDGIWQKNSTIVIVGVFEDDPESEKHRVSNDVYDFGALKGVGKLTVKSLADAGVKTLADFHAISDDALVDAGIARANVGKLREIVAEVEGA